MTDINHGGVDVWCGQFLVWWMSFFTHGVVDVWCGGCLCGGCRTIGLQVMHLGVLVVHFDRFCNVVRC